MKYIYVIEVDKGSWDDYCWWIHGIFDCPFKADEAKRLFLAKINKDLDDEDYEVREFANSINTVNVKEYPLNAIIKRH